MPDISRAGRGPRSVLRSTPSSTRPLGSAGGLAGGELRPGESFCFSSVARGGTRGLRLQAVPASALPVAVGGGKRESIGQVPDLAHRAVAQQDLNNVEAQFYAGLFEKLEVIERRLRKEPAFAGVHGCGRARPFLGRTRFDFHEHKAIAVAKDEIDFAARRTEVGSQEFHARSAQVFFGGVLAEFTPPQMLRLVVASQPGLDARPEVHFQNNSCCAGLSGAKLR